MHLPQWSLKMASKTALLNLKATARARFRASCVTSIQTIPDNLNFNISKKIRKQLIFATKASAFSKASTSLFMPKRLGLASLAISQLRPSYLDT